MTEQPQRHSNDNRHILRQLIIQALYNRDIKSIWASRNLEVLEVDNNEDADLAEHLGFETLSGRLRRKLRKGEEQIKPVIEFILAHKEALDRTVQEFAPAWPIQQINKVDLQIIRLALYEGFIAKKIPEKVAIDEAIELGKDFGQETNVKFISGVLGSIFSKSPIPTLTKLSSKYTSEQSKISKS